VLSTMTSDASFLRPFVIGIVGPSGAGKSSLAASLAELFDGYLFSEEQFKLPGPPSYQDRDPSWETPAHVDWDAYLRALKDFIRRAQEESCSKTVTIELSALKFRTIVIVEHFLLLHDDRVVQELDALFFLEPSGSDEEALKICMERRLNRKSNRSAEEVEDFQAYYHKLVWPSYKKLCQSQAREFCKMRSSDDSHPRAVHVDCSLPETEIVDQVRGYVEEWMGRSSHLSDR